MIICTWNVNGIKSLLDHDITYLARAHVDILLLQEVRTGNTEWLRELSHLLNLPHVYYNLSVRSGRAGVATLSRMPSQEQYAPDYILPGEGRILVTEFQDLCVVNLYSPYMGRDLVNLETRELWEEQILTFLLKLKKAARILLIGGDLNVAPTQADRYRVSRNQPGCSDQEASMFNRLLNDLELQDAFRTRHGPDAPGFTWGLHEGRLRIDYFLLSCASTWKIVDCNPIYTIHENAEQTVLVVGPSSNMNQATANLTSQKERIRSHTNRMPSDHYPLMMELQHVPESEIE